MAIGTPKFSAVVLPLLTLILLTTPPPSCSLPIPTTSFHALFSLSDSLFTRVANLRAARGDISGSIRARSIAQKIQKHSRGFSFYGVMWSLGWDYMKNYAWRDIGVTSSEMFGAASDMSELIRGLNELTRMESEAERVAWVRRNYVSVLTLSKSLFNRLLRVFSRSGPLKDAVEMVQAEIVEGGLLKDCLELGSNDLKGVIQILKDVALQYSSTIGKTELYIPETLPSWSPPSSPRSLFPLGHSPRSVVLYSSPRMSPARPCTHVSFSTFNWFLPPSTFRVIPRYI